LLTIAAYCYGNEDEVGEGLKEAFDSGIKREDIFVTTKLWCTYHSRVEQNLDMSLKSLGLDYVDLYLMHWVRRNLLLFLLYRESEDVQELLENYAKAERSILPKG
jgi:diketogulonate reductase-like aldo/keto reductase